MNVDEFQDWWNCISPFLFFIFRWIRVRSEIHFVLRRLRCNTSKNYSFNYEFSLCFVVSVVVDNRIGEVCLFGSLSRITAAIMLDQYGEIVLVLISSPNKIIWWMCWKLGSDKVTLWQCAVKFATLQAPGNWFSPRSAVAQELDHMCTVHDTLFLFNKQHFHARLAPMSLNKQVFPTWYLFHQLKQDGGIRNS